MPRLRRRECRKSGRCLYGTAQMRLSAFWVALVMPMPASSARTMPITSAAVLPVSECSFSWSRMIGTCPSVPSRILCCSTGSPWRMKPRIVTNTSSSGNSETNA